MSWVIDSFNKLISFFRKHSPLLKKEDRSLHKHSLILTAGLASLIEDMKEEYPEMKNELNLISGRLEWIFRQLMILYRIHYSILSKKENYRNGFFTIKPDGEIRINQKVYNVPKHYKEKGFYPSLIENGWVKVVYEGNRETQEGD